MSASKNIYHLIYNGNTAHKFLPDNLKLLDYEESEYDRIKIGLLFEGHRGRNERLVQELTNESSYSCASINSDH